MKRPHPAMRTYLLIPATALLTGGLLVPACTTNREDIPKLSAADSTAIVEENIAHRKEVDEFFRTDPNSPFNRDSTITFEGIRWFPIDPRFRVTSELTRYDHPDTVNVMGTKGEVRRNLRYGYFTFLLPDDNGTYRRFRLNVYKFTPYDAKRYALYRNNLSLWFTDRTTGNETYDVGRYVEIGDEHPDPHFRYTIDFNQAFNPYCAYSAQYTCAIPTKEDTLGLSLRVGEKNYHQP